MIHRSIPRHLLAILLAITAPLSAQDAPPPKPKDDGAIQVKLLAEQAPEALGKVALVFGEAKSAPLTLPVNGLSAPIPVPARTMVLKTEKDIALCSITLPEAGKAFAIILVVAKPAGYTPIIVRTDDPTFKPGDVMLLNRSDKTVLCKLGDTALAVKAGTSEKSHPTGPKENTYYDVAFGTRDETGDNVISTSRWPIDNTLRSYLFFFTTAEGRTSFRAVDEFVPPPQK